MIGVRFAGLFALIIVVPVTLVPSVHGQPSNVCEQALATAEEQYLDAEYENALQLVSSCLDREDISEEQAVSAYRQLALIHLKQDSLNRARSAIVNLLGVDSDYTADPVQNPPAYVSLVTIVKQDLQSEIAEREAEDESGGTPFFRRTSTWVTMSGILVGSGIATYFALENGSGGSNGGEQGPDTLPAPPGTP